MRPLIRPIGAARSSVGDERGFSLAEMLISLVLTLVVTGAAIGALLDTSRTARAGAALTDLNQNLRVSMNILIRDLLQTGRGIPTGGIPIPTGGATLPILRPGPAMSNLRFDETWSTLPAVTPGAGAGPIINGVATDVVTLLRVDPSLVVSDPLATIADDGSFITFAAGVDIGNAAAGVKPGDLIMLTNANGNALQEVTSISGQDVSFNSDAPSGLNQRDAPQGSVLSIRNGDGSWPPTTATRVLMITYYLSNVSTAGTATPSLMRRVNYGDERLIGVGIDNVQLTWDLVDGATNPSNVETPVSPNTPHQVRKANLHMSARTTDQRSSSPITSALTTQVSLRSLAFVDRYQ